jgi:GTP-binding protein HflX
LEETCRHLEVDTVLFGEDLSPVWQRNLERGIGTKVIDRTELILDIFAQHARTNDGKVQVELAQLRYLLPRLTGRGVLLSRLGGGIGTRGPGETKLEADRRRISARIDKLNREVEHLSKVRALERKNRLRRGKVLASIVGYTNTGKSTLLNALTAADVRVEDKLFATLDPTTRRFELPSGEQILLSDTVGFIRRLPTTLLHAFRATLEEVSFANLLLHVVDASSSSAEIEIESVDHVLRDLEANTKPTLLVFNKIDQVADPARTARFLERFPGSVAISAKCKTGLDALFSAIARLIREGREEITLEIPVAEGRAIAQLRDSAEVVEEVLEGECLRFRAVLPSFLLYRFETYIK